MLKILQSSRSASGFSVFSLFSTSTSSSSSCPFVVRLLLLLVSPPVRQRLRHVALMRQVHLEVEQHNQVILLVAKCPDPQCNSNYIGQTKCRLLKRVIQHNKQDKNSNHLIHSNDKSHHRVWLDDFEIIGKGFKSSFKRQISDALHIKEKAPDLNIQKDAYRLSLYS